ncbi:CDP-alcohol phosphatidyltransferase family protein [Candidatus Altiarchaeota archaeon]
MLAWINRFLHALKENRKITAPDVFPFTASQVSAASVLASFGVFFNPIIALLTSLVLDSFDGVVARSQNATSRDGGMIDWASDRYSEFIFYGYFALQHTPLLILLPVANTLLNLSLLRGWKVVIIPIRFYLLAYLVITRFLIA